MAEAEKKGPHLDQQISFLQRIAFFEDFDDHELTQFLGVSRWLKVPAETQIIKERSVEKVFYILVKGTVSVFKTQPGGKKARLTTLSAGDCFGEMALVSEIKRTAGVITLEESFILMVEPDIINNASVFLQLKFYRRFCEILVRRLVNANKLLVAADSAGTSKETSAALKRAKRPAVAQSVVSSAVGIHEGDEGGGDIEEPFYDPAELPPIPKKKPIGRMKIRQLILRDRLELPVNPAVAAQLSPFLVGACGDTRRFAELISLDPVITALVLQMANSSFYRRSTPIHTVPHALVTVGITEVQELLAKETTKIFRNDYFGGFSVLAQSFWHHSVVVAQISELLKDVTRINSSMDVYVAGLLHDFGILALDPLLPDFYPQLLREDFTDNLCESERLYIGSDHGLAGSWLGEMMGLPKPYLDVMKQHHAPEKIRESVLLTVLVHLADLFAKEQGSCFGGQCAGINVENSFGWFLLQDQHETFRDVNIVDFITLFRKELNREWPEISGKLSW